MEKDAVFLAKEYCQWRKIIFHVLDDPI